MPALAGLMCGALVAAALVVVPVLATSTTAASPSDLWTSDDSISWTPQDGVESYTLAAQVGDRTVRYGTYRCCSALLREFQVANAWYRIRSSAPGAPWSRPLKLRRGKDRPTPRPTPPVATTAPVTATAPPVVAQPPATVAPVTDAPVVDTPVADDPVTEPVPDLPDPTPPVQEPAEPVPSGPAVPPSTTDPTTVPTTQAPPTSTSPSPAGGGSTGPGPVCDRLPALNQTAPAGAVVVNPGVVDDVATKTDANPAGTTFWLAPGRHVLSDGEFAQIIPKSGNTYLGAPGAVLDGRGKNRYAFTQHASNVTIRGLTVRGFASPADEGVVNHDSGDGWVIESNTIEENHGAGLMAGSRQRVVGNCLRNNGQYAMNAFQSGDKMTGLVVSGNEIVGNNADDLERANPGCGCTGGIKFWSVNGADIRNNWVHDNRGVGLWADTNNNDFLIENNLIENNDDEGLFYETSYNLVLRGNTFKGNALTKGKEFADRGDTFPVGAVYLSESGGDSAVPARTSSIDITGNVFDNNWSGITAWENADRFCNSAANTSTGYCTKRVAKTSSCSQPGIASAPLFSDCRWKTQNVKVHGNTFRFAPSAVGCTNGLCGRMSVLSNVGTFPASSPYKGTGVQQAITFKQGNVWSGNSYSGPWTFMPIDTGHVLTAAQWQAAPYGQDACSSFTGGGSTC